MSLRIVIDSGNREPIFRQIIGQVKLAVARGHMRTGDELPSVRGLAEQLVVNPNTVARAYSELQRDGIVDSMRGKGFVIAKPRSVYSEEERERILREAEEQFMREVIMLGYTRKEIIQSLDTYMREELKKDKGHEQKD